MRHAGHQAAVQSVRRGGALAGREGEAGVEGGRVADTRG